MPKPKPNPADPDCPVFHGEARDEVRGCVLDAIEAICRGGETLLSPKEVDDLRPEFAPHPRTKELVPHGYCNPTEQLELCETIDKLSAALSFAYKVIKSWDLTGDMSRDTAMRFIENGVEYPEWLVDPDK